MNWLLSVIVNSVRVVNTYMSLMLLWGLPVSLLVLVVGVWHWALLASADVIAYYVGEPGFTWWPDRYTAGIRPIADYVVPSLDTALGIVAFTVVTSATCIAALTVRTKSSLLRTSLVREAVDRRELLGLDHPLTTDLICLTQTSGIRRVPMISITPLARPHACVVSSVWGAEVSISIDLVRSLSREQLRWVLAHELAHLRHRDSYWRLIWHGSVQALGYSERVFYWITRFVFSATQGLFGRWLFLTVYIVFLIYPLNAVRLGQRAAMLFYRTVDAWISRQCEYRADQFAARLVSSEAGVGVLKTLGGDGEPNWPSLFASHPPLSARIKKLEKV